ncbi:MAG: glycosyltransferase involved in cell wall biosynthesis [Maribacter sp.]|jgi:glycosyltransferase involved in cell wall biosynthesis
MKTSVCMAVYNGANFLHRSIPSILSQLKENDEIIVIDDYSTDNSISILQSFQDKRIHIFANDKNEGASPSFFKALKKATGDIIFLADQDDLWLPEKVNIVLEIFNSKKVGIVVHDAIIIKEGKEWGKSLFTKNNSGGGFLKNILSNKYIGCCMALSKETKNKILPRYINPEVYHDHYLGVKGESKTRIKTYFLKKSLIRYYRHSETHTNIFQKRKLRTIVKERWQLCYMLFKNI